MTGQFRGSVVLFPRFGVTVQKPFIDINCFNQLSVQNTTGSSVYLLDEAELFTHEVSKGKAAIKVMERDEHGALSESSQSTWRRRTTARAASSTTPTPPSPTSWPK